MRLNESKGGSLGQVTPWSSWQNLDTERGTGWPKPEGRSSRSQHPQANAPPPTATFSAKAPESVLMEQAVQQRQIRGGSRDTPRWARDSD